MNQSTLAAVMLTALGCLQMIGDLSGSRLLKGLGAASHASPAPKVFTAQQGFETFSSRFYLEWQDKQSHPHRLELTPENYSHLRGPYNRRNAYGAALSYGPVLTASPATRPMFDSASRFALCGRRPALKELGIDPDSVQEPVTIHLVPRDPASAAGHWTLVFPIDCRLEIPA